VVLHPAKYVVPFVVLAGLGLRAQLSKSGPLRTGAQAPQQAPAPAPVTDVRLAAASPEPKSRALPAEARGQGEAACPFDMVHVSGNYCPEVEQTCKAYLDPPPYQNLRCGEYSRNPRCVKPKVAKDFCIDREEHTDPGTDVARVDVSFIDAKSVCASAGKTLCKEDEWTFACEGEEMRPYPYGFTRDSKACNIDKNNLGSPGKGLRDLRAPNSAYAQCMSPFGVHNMTGNVDEWAERDGAQKSVLHGGWWLPGRNRCRATTAEHGPEYTAKQVGFRCCKSTEEGAH
jgi:formylglycine-generating enzyme